MMWKLAKFAITLLLLAAPSVQAMDSSRGRLEVTPVVRGLDTPWSLGFLPDGALLITERDGRLLHIKDDRSRSVRGLPAIEASGQGGLLDVLVPRDFAKAREIFLTFSKSQGRGAGTALARGVLSADGAQLNDVKILFEIARGSSGGRHFGSRLVEGRDGALYMTVGDRGDRPSAQDLGSHNGAVLRLNRDGTVPRDNPFVGREGAQPQIWSFGHRNPQGAALDARGRLWVHEHGAQGGDEVNLVRKGANYGWPVIAYGRHYSGAKIGEGTEKAGLEQPRHYWDPSIAPSGMMIYSGALWPEWRGDLFVGSLKFDMISRLDGDTLREVERLESPETGRVRDIREAPDGAIWFLSEYEGAAFRVTPAP